MKCFFSVWSTSKTAILRSFLFLISPFRCSSKAPSELIFKRLCVNGEILLHEIYITKTFSVLQSTKTFSKTLCRSSSFSSHFLTILLSISYIRTQPTLSQPNSRYFENRDSYFDQNSNKAGYQAIHWRLDFKSSPHWTSVSRHSPQTRCKMLDDQTSS